VEVLATAGFALSIVDEKKTVLALRQILLKFCRHRIKTFTALMRKMPLASLTLSLLLRDH
jgi:hypothetical protein